MFRWDRLPVSDAAGSASADTTEQQIGSGIDVPTWANSIIAATIQVCTLALTTKEEVTGYWRIVDDNNTIDPLNFPLPMSVCLTGAIGTHISPLMLTVPCFHSVAPNDTLRVYAALDAASTGVHTWAAHILFSSMRAPMEMKSQKSAAVAFETTAGTLTAATSLNTLEKKTSAIIGLGNSFLVYPTAAESFGGHITVESAAKDWQKQTLPVSMAGSGLSTQITPLTQPVICILPELKKWLDQVVYIPFPQEFPLNSKETFNFKNTPIMDQSVAGAGRYFLIWRE